VRSIERIGDLKRFLLRPSLTHACVKKPVRNESNPIPTFRPAPARLESDLKNGAQKGADHIPKTEFTGTHRHRPYASTDFRIATVLDYPCERYRESYPGHSTLDRARPNQPAFFSTKRRGDSGAAAPNTRDHEESTSQRFKLRCTKRARSADSRLRRR